MINTEIYLISADYLKRVTPVMSNVEDQFINQHILEAQNITLQQTLGKDLYEEIINQFIAYKDRVTTSDPITDFVSALNLVLIDDFITTILVYNTMYFSVYDLYQKITNKGIVTQHSDYSQNSDFKIIEKTRKDYGQKADSYTTLLIDYLNTNAIDYPLWVNTCDNTLTERSLNTMYLGKNI